MKILNSYLKPKIGKNLRSALMGGILTATLPLCAMAQADIHFSQFYETSILRNPALTGVFADDFKLGAYTRNQWSSVSYPYVTMLVTAETRMPISRVSDDFLSFGLLAYADKAGSIDHKITAIYPALNYNKSINPNHNTYFSVGFTGGYVQYSFDPTKATFNNQYQNGSYNIANPTNEILPTPKMAFYDVGAGVNYNTSAGPNNKYTYIIGVSGYHFSQPTLSYYNKKNVTENMRFNGNASASGIIDDKMTVMLQAYYSQQGTYREVIAGGMINYIRSVDGLNPLLTLSGGLFYRLGDAIIPVVKLNYKAMALGISYDVNVSSLKDASHLQGGYELTLFFTGNYTDKGISRKTVCPKY